MGFTEDLALGHSIEDYVSKLLLDRNPRASVTIPKTPDQGYDLALDLRDGIHDLTYFEVKYDSPAPRTGKLAIEFSCNGLPSGIEATKADYWVQVVPAGKHTDIGGVFTIRTAKLLTYVYNPIYEIVSGGDGNRALLILVHYKDFKQFVGTNRLGDPPKAKTLG
jgi:hypothetical protein